MVAKGCQLAEVWTKNRQGLNENQRVIVDYYSRPEIQRAMFRHAKGRKISALRTFRPLYNRIEAPSDILYIALYHAGHKGMWPSLHGMISRYLDESNQHVCDFVIEVNKIRSQACFEATLPYVEVLQDFGIYARLKFSGHVIIQDETFPLPADVGNIRKQFAAVSGVREHLMNYVQKIVKHLEKLDRYFLRISHFLRLAYSTSVKIALFFCDGPWHAPSKHLAKNAASGHAQYIFDE